MFCTQEEVIRNRLQSVISIGHETVAENQPNIKPRQPSPDTVYGIGSMTKSFVVACLAKVRGEGKEVKFEWSTPMKDLLKGFETDAKIQHMVTLSDFLSHRTGLSGNISIAHQGDQEFILTKDELLPAVTTLDKVGQFRSDWVYNNWVYNFFFFLLLLFLTSTSASRRA
ncbi:hypothetical protein SMAC4_13290 [Sordaria macrospora]|uniref:uncharacterized protein n=1 Tax=Sordaria macrospora TaxID=5147 RepID=UPI002B29BE53|nr:hypothetical protein SMAC4_13290 [Sordaria macrospora]